MSQVYPTGVPFSFATDALFPPGVLLSLYFLDEFVCRVIDMGNGAHGNYYMPFRRRRRVRDLAPASPPGHGAPDEVVTHK